jgi:hypothetical protein
MSLSPAAHPPTPPTSLVDASHLPTRVVLLTQHGKEHLIAPVFQQTLGWHVERVDGFDTDLLGTFTRDTERPGSQMDAARLKARKGMELAGCPRGIASEGAFMEDPVGGFFPWNVELLLYIDDELGVEVSALAQGPARNVHAWVHSWDEVTQAAADARFPEHHLVLRPDNESDPRVVKGLADWASLRAAFDHAQALSSQGVVFVESDLRAFGNPTRQHLIRAAAENLVVKLQVAVPGMWAARLWAGGPVARLALPTMWQAHAWPHRGALGLCGLRAPARCAAPHRWLGRSVNVRPLQPLTGCLRSMG